MRRIFNNFIYAIEIIKTFKNWPIVFIHFLGLFNSGLFTIGPYMVCTLRNGRRFKVRIRAQEADVSTILSIWAEKPHRLSRENIEDGSLVIDIGAHIGSFSVLAATLASDVKVYAYEPEPDNFRLLLDNIRLNSLENCVKPFEAAVVAEGEQGKQKLFIGNVASTHSFRLKTSDQGYMTVDCLTMKDILEQNKIERCDFLKIDCEGSEYDILFSTPEEYLRKIRKIHVEYHEGPGINYNRRDLVDFLKQAGFEVTLESWHPSFGYIYAEKILDSGKE